MAESEIGDDVELGLNNEDLVQPQLRFNIQDRNDAPARDANGAYCRLNIQDRMSFLQVGLLAVAISLVLIYDLSIKPLAGLHIFALYGSLFMGLMLLTAALPWSPVSAPAITKIAWIAALLVHIALGLKMRLPQQS